MEVIEDGDVIIDGDDDEDVIVIEDQATPVVNSVIAHNERISKLLKEAMLEHWQLRDNSKEKCCPLNLRNYVLKNYEKAILRMPNKVMSLDDFNLGMNVRGIGKVALAKVWSVF